MGKKYRTPLDVAIGAYKRRSFAEEDLERMDKLLSTLVAALGEEDFRAYAKETTEWDRQQAERRKVQKVPA